MEINRGYVPGHKVFCGNKKEPRTITIYTVECPNCKEHMQLKGDYSENLDNPVKCSFCGFLAAGYNFTYINSTLGGETTDDKE